MKKHRYFKWAAVISIAGLCAVLVGNGCQEFGAWSGKSVADGVSSSSALGGDVGGVNTPPDIGMDVIPGAKTASMVYSNEVLTHLASCAGVATPSDATVAMYEAKKGAISVYGQANTITSPMMMAITSIAGEVCNDLINQEVKLGGRIFKNMNMSANTLPNNADLVDSVSRIALSCWGRN